MPGKGRPPQAIPSPISRHIITYYVRYQGSKHSYIYILVQTIISVQAKLEVVRRKHIVHLTGFGAYSSTCYKGTDNCAGTMGVMNVYNNDDTYMGNAVEITVFRDAYIFSTRPQWVTWVGHQLATCVQWQIQRKCTHVFILKMSVNNHNPPKIISVNPSKSNVCCCLYIWYFIELCAIQVCEMGSYHWIDFSESITD